MEIVLGILIPFIGTTLGSSMVFFMKNTINLQLQKFLLGFASGVMIAASIWSLILPAIEQSEHLGKLSFLPSAIGLILGFIFLIFIDILSKKISNKNYIEATNFQSSKKN